MNISIELLLERIALKLYNLEMLELYCINRGSYTSAAVYTGKIAAFNEMVEALKEQCNG
jgi:hypothetical protein